MRIEVRERLIPRTPLLRRYATCLTAMMFVWAAVSSQGATPVSGVAAIFPADVHAKTAVSVSQDSPASGSSYEGKTVVAIDLPGVAERDRDHLFELLPQKVGSYPD